MVKKLLKTLSNIKRKSHLCKIVQLKINFKGNHALKQNYNLKSKFYHGKHNKNKIKKFILDEIYRKYRRDIESFVLLQSSMQSRFERIFECEIIIFSFFKILFLLFNSIWRSIIHSFFLFHDFTRPYINIDHKAKFIKRLRPRELP